MASEETEDIRATQSTPLESLSERLTFPEEEARVTALTALYNTAGNSKLLFSDIRHGLRLPVVEIDPPEAGLVSKWRQKDRLKTTAVALVVCLNIGVDPPDVIKISPCARIECWVDPLSMQAPKALDTIGKNLQAQYERWQPRAKYKMHLDPTTDDVKKLVTSCRRSAKGERVLFHYNGHGVPRPTANGEIWVFNKSYTQYIPLSIYDLQSWVGTPAIYIFDCSIAGQILSSFKQFFSSTGRDQWDRKKSDADNIAVDPLKDTILMCACSENELLPQDPSFPADLFTACLTTPIKIALHWFCSKSLLHSEGITKEIIDRIPGKQTDRKTPLGELNWIFTAITDTIAWNVLPRSLFQRLFRQDLLVASLFRNFLLAQRILRSMGCSPASHPRLPLMDQHPMWLAWDMAAETCLLQLPGILEGNSSEKEYQPSPFFSEQLTAFELWLDHGSMDKSPPEQLPIVLQVLLSQVHRLRALVLLGRFIDMGSWAVDLALSVGIFPYILKLLQTSATDLRQTLVFIWAKIVSWDMNAQVQNDLTKDGGYLYFIKHLESDDADIVPESRAQAAFVLAAICRNNKKGKLLCAQAGLLQTCSAQIPATAAALASTQCMGSDGSQQLEYLLKWLIICVGHLCEDVQEIWRLAMESQIFDLLTDLSRADSPNIRASAVFALGGVFQIRSESTQVPESPSEIEKSVICRLLEGIYDGSQLVRCETVRTLYRAAASNSTWISREMSIKVRQQIMNDQIEGGMCKSAPILRQMNSSSAQDLHCKLSAPDESHVHKKAHSVDEGNTFSTTDDHPDIGQDRDPIAGLLVDGLTILAVDPAWDVRAQALQALMDLGMEEIPNCNVPVAKSIAPDLSTAVKKAEDSRAMTSPGMSFLPKSWQAKSWRTFSHSSGKSLQNERMTVMSRDDSTTIHDQFQIDNQIRARGNLMSSINFMGQQYYKWPLLSPLAEEEPGISWLKSCTPTKLQIRKQMKSSGIARCRSSRKVRLREQVHAINTNGSAIEAIFLEPFKPQIVTADSAGRIRVFDYLQAKLLNQFDATRDSTKVSAVRSMFRLNDLYNELLLACCRNGNVTVWRYFAKSGCEMPAASWQSIGTEGNCHQQPIYTLSKDYLGGSLFAGAFKTKIGRNAVNVWDLHREYCVNEVVSTAEDPSRQYRQIKASTLGSRLYTLDDGGTLEIFDMRSNKSVSKQPLGKDVIGVIPELTENERTIIAGHKSGRINFFDNRMTTPNGSITLDKNIDGHSKGTMTVIQEHSHAPIFATATSSQVVKVWSAKGEQLGVVRAHTSILGQPIGPTKCLAFSPFSLKLSSGGEDAVCAVYSLEHVSV